MEVKIKSTICFSKNDLGFWNEFLTPNSFFNTEGNFIRAHRPYWDYYLDRLDGVCLLGDESVCEDKHLKQCLIEMEKNGRLTRGIDSRSNILCNYVKDAKPGDIIILTTKKRKSRFVAELRRVLPELSTKKILLLPEKVAGIELEPGWYLIKEYLNNCQPALVISCLGWERVAYAARIQDIYGASYFDWGDSAAMNEAKFCVKDEIKRVIKKVLKLN